MTKISQMRDEAIIECEGKRFQKFTNLFPSYVRHQ